MNGKLCRNMNFSMINQYDSMRPMRYVLTLIVSSLCLLSCTTEKPNDDINDLSQSKTNLEFWIAQNVDNVDWSKYQKKYGIMGGREFYGTGYTPTLDEWGQQVDPEHCVIYTVTSYPDYSDKAQHITSIYITDPAIEVYGLTVNSTFDEFESVVKGEGFVISGSNEHYMLAEKGKFSISITKTEIRIRVEVENKTGMEF